MTRTTIACKNCRYDKNKVWLDYDMRKIMNDFNKSDVSPRLIELEQRLMLIGFCSLFPLTNNLN